MTQSGHGLPVLPLAADSSHSERIKSRTAPETASRRTAADPYYRLSDPYFGYSDPYRGLHDFYTVPPYIPDYTYGRQTGRLEIVGD